MSDFNIKIKTEAEGQGAQQTLSWLEKLKAGASSVGAAYKEAGGGISGLISAVSQLGGVVAAAFAALAGVFLFLSKAVKEYAESEKHIAKLDKALAKQGNLTEEVRQRYQDLASQMEETTGIADDEWTKVLTKLTQFGATPDNIEQNVRAVKSLSSVMDGDLSAAATAVSRALQGNFQIFSRYGIQIDEVGTRTQRLAKLYEVLELRGGGVASSGKTLSYYFSNVGNQLSNFMEAIGGVISRTGVLQIALYGVGRSLQFIANAIQSVSPKLDGLHNGIKASAASMVDAEASAEAMASALKKVKDATEEANNAFEKQNAILKRRQQYADETTDANMAEQLGLVDYGEARGDISGQDAVLARARIRTTAEREKFERGQKAKADDITSLKGQELINRRPVEAAQSEARALAQKAAAAAKNQEALKKQIEEADAAEREAEEGFNIGPANWGKWAAKQDSSGNGGDISWQAYLNAAFKATQELSSARMRSAALRRKYAKPENDAAMLKLQAEQADKKAKKLEEEARPKLDELEQARILKEDDLAHQASIFPTRQRTADLSSAKDLMTTDRSAVSAAAAKGKADASALSSGRALPAAADAAIDAYTRVADETVNRIQRLIQIAHENKGKTNTLDTRITELEKAVKPLKVKGGTK